MKITGYQVSIIDLVLIQDKEWKFRTFPLNELSIASSIYKKIKTGITIIKIDENTGTKKYNEIELKLTSEEKVFITKLVDERNWTVNDADELEELKKLLK